MPRALPSDPGAATPDGADVSRLVLPWYLAHQRDLPWRRPGVGAYAVLVSEVMLQQTPVARVLPVYEAWLKRWPTAADLAAAPSGEAVRAWGRLGYPRRALRLHQACVAVVEQHGGEVPSAVAELLALPGIGTYTARAIAAFAWRQRVPVVDTNVARVFARAVRGRSDAGPSVGVADLAAVEAILPLDAEDAATVSVALMELGALVCTARTPRCGVCPLGSVCAWQLAGAPDTGEPPRKVQSYAGTDRQCRGRLLGVLRDAAGPVGRDLVLATWSDVVQRERALASLVADGLVVELPGRTLALPP